MIGTRNSWAPSRTRTRMDRSPRLLGVRSSPLNMSPPWSFSTIPIDFRHWNDAWSPEDRFKQGQVLLSFVFFHDMLPWSGSYGELKIKLPRPSDKPNDEHHTFWILHFFAKFCNSEIRRFFANFAFFSEIFFSYLQKMWWWRVGWGDAEGALLRQTWLDSRAKGAEGALKSTSRLAATGEGLQSIRCLGRIKRSS